MVGEFKKVMEEEVEVSISSFIFYRLPKDIFSMASRRVDFHGQD